MRALGAHPPPRRRDPLGPLGRTPRSPGRYLESFVVESWLEHLRQHERITAADREVQGSRAPSIAAPSRRASRHFIHERMPARR